MIEFTFLNELMLIYKRISETIKLMHNTDMTEKSGTL